MLDHLLNCKQPSYSFIISKAIRTAILSLIGLLSACTSQDVDSLTKRYQSDLSIIDRVDIKRSHSFIVSPHNHIALAINAQDSNTDIPAALYASKKTLDHYFSQVSIANSRSLQSKGGYQPELLNDALVQARSNRAAFLLWLTIVEGTTDNKALQVKRSTFKNGEQSNNKGAPNSEAAHRGGTGIVIKSVHYDVATGKVIDVAIINLQAGLLSRSQPLSKRLNSAMTQYIKQLTYYHELAVN